MKNNIFIENREIGKNVTPYIIAELSANHNGNIEVAMKSIEIAKSCGADAIKIQTYNAESMTIDSDEEDFKINDGLWKGYNLYQLYEEAHTPYDWHKPMFEHAKKEGITIFSSPFDEKAVDLLEDLNVSAYKVASFEITDIPLIKYIASTNKPMILSTGMANENEISEAVNAVRDTGHSELALLHCVSSYPTPIEQSNLATINKLASDFNVVVGLSDHTLGITASLTGVSLGASIIEKHFILDRNDKGPDSEFSIEPYELKTLCRQVKEVWSSIGVASYERKQAEEDNVKFRRSIYVVEDIHEGETFNKNNLRRIRPGFGLSPKHYEDVLGKKARVSLKRGTALTWKMIE